MAASSWIAMQSSHQGLFRFSFANFLIAYMSALRAFPYRQKTPNAPLTVIATLFQKSHLNAFS